MLDLEIYWDPGYALGLSFQRPADRHWFDFTPGVVAFAAVVPPATGLTLPLAEAAPPLAGIYRLGYGPTPGGVWWDGTVIVGVHDLGSRPPGGPPTAPKCLFRFPLGFAKGNALPAASPFFLSY